MRRAVCRARIESARLFRQTIEGHNARYAYGPETNVNEGLLQFARREMRAEFSRPVLWVVLAGIGIILAFAGAFGTASALRPIPLAIYWMVVVVLTYATGTLVHVVLRHRFARSSLFLRILCIGLVTGVSVSLVVAAINAVVFGPMLSSWKGWSGFFGTIILVAFLVNGLLELVQRELSPQVARGTGGNPGSYSD